MSKINLHEMFEERLTKSMGENAKMHNETLRFFRNATFDEVYKNGYLAGYTAALNDIQPKVEKLLNAMEEIYAKKTMTIYNYSEEFMKGANAANVQCSEIAENALAEFKHEGER